MHACPWSTTWLEVAAKSLLKDWEAGEGVKQLKTPAKEAIIKLSIDSSVVSAHTAYVAVHG